jgi:glycosyltransferase involved in cell wall biosynthesis
MAEISVLIPVRNAAGTLRIALTSVARQTEQDWECVVIDDGSSDSSLGIAEAYARSDSRFRVFPRSPRGIVAALNEGLSLCRGRYVARMDADDWMHANRLAWQRRALAENLDWCGVGGHVRFFPRSSLRAGLLAYEAWLNSLATPDQVRREAFVECPIAHPSLFARREILASFAYRDTGWPEDYDLILRLLGAGLKLGVVARPLLFWRDGPTRSSRTHPAYRSKSFTACKAAHLAATFLAHSREYVLWGYGDTGRTLCSALTAFDKFPSHIVELHPGRIGQRIAGAAVIEPKSLIDVPRRPIIASVAGITARAEIREALRAMGFEELSDFVVAA